MKSKKRLLGIVIAASLVLSQMPGGAPASLAASKIKLSAKKMTLYVKGQGGKKTATLKLMKGKKKLAAKFVSNKPKTASVKKKTGKVKAVKKGKAVIRATYQGKTYKCTVTVKDQTKTSQSPSVSAEPTDGTVTSAPTSAPTSAATPAPTAGSSAAPSGSPAGTDPGVTPGGDPGATEPGTTPGGGPGATEPGATDPGADPGDDPGATPGGNPDATPGGDPGATPGGDPGATEPGTPSIPTEEPVVKIDAPVGFIDCMDVSVSGTTTQGEAYRYETVTASNFKFWDEYWENRVYEPLELDLLLEFVPDMSIGEDNGELTEDDITWQMKKDDATGRFTCIEFVAAKLGTYHFRLSMGEIYDEFDVEIIPNPTKGILDTSGELAVRKGTPQQIDIAMADGFGNAVNVQKGDCLSDEVSYFPFRAVKKASEDGDIDDSETDDPGAADESMSEKEQAEIFYQNFSVRFLREDGTEAAQDSDLVAMAELSYIGEDLTGYYDIFIQTSQMEDPFKISVSCAIPQLKEINIEAGDMMQNDGQLVSGDDLKWYYEVRFADDESDPMNIAVDDVTVDATYTNAEGETEQVGDGFAFFGKVYLDEDNVVKEYSGTVSLPEDTEILYALILDTGALLLPEDADVKVTVVLTADVGKEDAVSESVEFTVGAVRKLDVLEVDMESIQIDAETTKGDEIYITVVPRDQYGDVMEPKSCSVSPASGSLNGARYVASAFYEDGEDEGTKGPYAGYQILIYSKSSTQTTDKTDTITVSAVYYDKIQKKEVTVESVPITIETAGTGE